MDYEFDITMLALHKIRGFGEKKMFVLAPMVLAMQDVEELTASALNELANQGTISPLCEISDIENWIDEAKAEVKAWGEDGVRVTTAFSQDYPSPLKEIENHPFFLYYKGDIAPLNKKNVALVGTRVPSDDGLREAKIIARKLIKNGFGIVSGLAIGCDTAGHEGALDEGGYTCAVMAHGLDIVNPTKNRDLATRILENGGALVSEHKPGVPPTRRYYFLRNRIQSALSTHVIVIETTATGGTMHTARFARDQDRSLIVLDLHAGDNQLEFQAAMKEICSELNGNALKNPQSTVNFITDETSEEE